MTTPCDLQIFFFVKYWSTPFLFASYVERNNKKMLQMLWKFSKVAGGFCLKLYSSVYVSNDVIRRYVILNLNF